MRFPWKGADTRYALLFLCCIFNACSAHENRDEEASKILKSWAGQPITVAEGALGPATRNIQKPPKKIYSWITERDENVRLIGGREIVRDGFIDNPSSDHFNIKGFCRIIIVTDANDIILSSGMKGQIITCSQFADALQSAEVKPPAQ